MTCCLTHATVKQYVSIQEQNIRNGIMFNFVEKEIEIIKIQMYAIQRPNY